MPATEERQITIEKTPSYFISSRVVERIRQMSPDVRLIVVLRDPVSRALSDYAQARTKRPSLPAFEQLAFRPADIDNDFRSSSPGAAGVSGSGSPMANVTSYGEVNASWRAVQIGLYAVHLRRWMAHFRRDRIHFVSGERLVTDPTGTVDDVQRFLGLRRAVTEKNFRFSAVKPGFPCLVRDPLRASSVLHCLGKTKGRRHPDVDPHAVEKLRNFFRPYNEKLYRMTGVDFRWP